MGINLSKEMRGLQTQGMYCIECLNEIGFEQFEMQFGRIMRIAKIEKCHKATKINALSTINEIYID